MPLELCRIDDRLIHGQVVLGWGQQMRLGFIVLVDDEVAESEWERELYRMGVPPEVGKGAVRLSVGRFTTEDEIERAATMLVGAASSRS